MYFLSKFCCICMNNSDMKHLFEVDNDGISHYKKLTSSIAEMNFKEMNDQRFICGECCVTLNTVYNFRQTCLRSKRNLINYISQLQTFSHVSGTLSVRLIDIKHEIGVVKEEIYIKCENKESSSSFEESNPLSEFKTESYEESIQFPASVKEECEDSSAHEDTVDLVNEGAHSYVKVEMEDHIEEEPYIEVNERDYAEDPLAVVKEEPTSDNETPQDGSTSPRPHKCVICEKSFKRKNHLNIHMRIHSERKPYACDVCNKGFARRSDLTRHMRMHTGEKPYECEVCNKKFTDRNNLIPHMRIHSGEKPYTCQICEKSFSCNSNLKVHLRIHYGERPYECEICKKSFTINSNLTTHMAVHSNETPFECEICKKKFNLKWRLTRHMLLHSGEKPHVCHICQKSFNEKSNLNKHIRTHSGKRQYECEICKKSFTVNSTLTKHMFTKHNFIRKMQEKI